VPRIPHTLVEEAETTQSCRIRALFPPRLFGNRTWNFWNVQRSVAQTPWTSAGPDKVQVILAVTKARSEHHLACSSLLCKPLACSVFKGVKLGRKQMKTYLIPCNLREYSWVLCLADAW